MYGVPGKGIAGGGTLALTGAAMGSWIVAGIGLVLLGALLLFVGARANRS